jgi:hypothetical protein
MRHMSAHALHMGRGADIGFGGDQAAIGALAHPKRIGQLHPLERIDGYAQVPAVQGVPPDCR